jgi:hypothetical protein
MDDLIGRISQSFGEELDRVTKDLDEFIRSGGTEAGIQEALDTTGPKGYPYFRTLLTKERFMRVKPEVQSKLVAWCQKRYADAQANPNLDTAAKRLAAHG